MGKSREIKKRLKAVANIRRITKTMQMIATSKFSRAQQESLAGKPYSEALFGLVSELAGACESDHPLLTGVPEAEGKPELTLILTSDRGLCGPYNGSIIRTALAHIRSSEKVSGGTLEVVGRKGATVLKFNGVRVDTHHTQFGDKPRYEDVEKLCQRYIDLFQQGEVSAVRVVSMKYISAGRQRPEVLQLLPFRPAEQGDQPSRSQYEFSPSEHEMLDRVVPAAAKALLFQAFKDAVVSEHIARMVAMKAATDNAGKMGQRLNREFNRARQAQITTELTEIVSGAAALS